MAPQIIANQTILCEREEKTVFTTLRGIFNKGGESSNFFRFHDHAVTDSFPSDLEGNLQSVVVMGSTRSYIIPKNTGLS
jgi:hypothetical protein